MKGLYAIVPIWGATYVRRWLDISLASLLAPGNLPELARQHDLKVLLYTTEEDLRTILPSPAFKMLRDVCAVRVLPFAPTAAEARRRSTNVVMTELHNHGLEQAWRDDHGAILLCADLLYADGSFRFVSRAITAGKRAVLTQTVDAPQASVEPLLATLATRAGPALTIAPRDLAKIWLRTMHWSFRLQVWDAAEFSSHPSSLYWKLGEHGLLMRSWHLWPLFVYPERRSLIRATADYGFIDGVAGSADDCALVGDSDDGLLLGVADSDRTAFHPAVPFPANPAFMVAWCRHWTTPMTRQLIRRHKFLIHDGVDRAEWRDTESRSDEVIDDILALYARGEAAAARGRPTS